jgi:hypothetical protein
VSGNPDLGKILVGSSPWNSADNLMRLRQEERMKPLNFSSPAFLIILIEIVFVFVLGAVAYTRMRKGNTFQLHNRFGSEYDRAVVEQGSERKAEAKLADRQSSVDKLKLRDLGDAERDRFLTDWHSIESRFIDHPKRAATEADKLISSLLRARGYPITNFEQSLEHISIYHSRIIEFYRSAHAVVARSGKAEASTEELRVAMIDYRTLFDDLVEEEAPVEIRSA